MLTDNPFRQERIKKNTLLSILALIVGVIAVALTWAFMNLFLSLGFITSAAFYLIGFTFSLLIAFIAVILWAARGLQRTSFYDLVDDICTDNLTRMRDQIDLIIKRRDVWVEVVEERLKPPITPPPIPGASHG